MTAYVLVDCDVTDPVRYEEYRRLAPVVIAKYGGRYLVRGGATTVLEGEWQPKRIVVLEFPMPTPPGGSTIRPNTGPRARCAPAPRR